MPMITTNQYKLNKSLTEGWTTAGLNLPQQTRRDSPRDAPTCRPSAPRPEPVPRPASSSPA